MYFEARKCMEEDLYNNCAVMDECAVCPVESIKSIADCDFKAMSYKDLKTVHKHLMDSQKSEDVVNHPSHYCRGEAMECFEEFLTIYGVEAAMHACLFNIHKYRYRASDKNGEEDLKKSDWYMRKYKELKEAKENELPF